MCGIAGIAVFGKKGISLKDSVYKMSHSIAHRGPDDEGFVLIEKEKVHILGSEHSDPNVFNTSISYCPKEKIETKQNNDSFLALAHRRLSILDLSPAGHQPMSYEGDRYWITFNGEIYNYIEIREELINKGVSFKTQSDTEVVLAAYHTWGEKCVEKFNGMWAFAIYDKEKNTLFASRDRFGVKPFYYYNKDGIFCFASEQKAIAQLDFVVTGINDKAVFDFLAHTEQEYQPEGFFKNILELFPSHNINFDLNTGELSIHKYYNLPVNKAFEDFSEEKYAKHIESSKVLFSNSIRRRLRSDVPVGCCLSGGIDSSAIAGAMHSLQSKEAIHLFTAVFPNEKIDESKWAKSVAESTHSQWHTITPDGNDLFKELEDLVYCQDLPLWSTSTYAQFKVMQLVKQKGIKVVLDGQGGDELFAGYTPYFSYYWDELLANKGNSAVLTEMKKKGKLSKEALYWIKEQSKKKDKGLLQSLRKLKTQPNGCINKSFQKKFGNEQKEAAPKTLNGILEKEFINSRLKLYLKCEDRCGMWHSVESRTPFADDIEMIENTFAIAGSYKLHNGYSKSLLRDAVKDLIPKAIYERKDKMGYVTPNNRWLSEHKEKIKEIIGDSINEYIDKTKLFKLIDNLGSQEHEQTIVFKALTLAVWRKVFKL